MPSCSVITCKNRSQDKNIANSGISYHAFPKNPNLKEKWIDATGRPENWFPTKFSTICSKHFEEKWFQPMTKSRRLFPKAVPTLRLRLVFDDAPSTSTTREEKSKPKKTIVKRTEDKMTLEQYKVTLERYRKGMRYLRLKIRNLQVVLRRSRKRNEVLKSILNALKNENIVTEEHIWMLESDVLK